jgi:flavin-dependent dehydrogenase
VQHVDAIIVGGGPAGSSCAWRLRHHGVDCLILDKEVFPRTKLCAGWITPEVVSDLEIDIPSYPHRFLTFETTRVHLFGLSFGMHSPQHSIRRYEFDHWLLQRSGAPVATHTVRKIERRDDRYVIDDAYTCRYLIGAGGTRCPVYRSLFRDANPRAKELQAVTLEHELPYDWDDGDCHLWFLEKGLPGYSWYVPKRDGYINVGIGGMAERLKSGGDDIKRHWDHFAQGLRRRGFIDGAELSPKGYSYYLRSGVDIARLDNAFVIGDSAGLATRDLCEGIGPAVRSGLHAADAIALGTNYALDDVGAYSLPSNLARRALEYAIVKRGQSRRGAGARQGRVASESSPASHS